MPATKGETGIVALFSKIDLRFWAAGGLLTFLGLGLRLYGIWEYEFWTDELMALRTSRDWDTIHDHCFRWLSSPPTRYAITRFLIYQFFVPQLIRLPSLIAGTLSIPFVIFLARRWWGKEVALWTGLAMAMNPWSIAHSQDGRMHILALFFILAGIALAIPDLPRFKRSGLVVGGICWALASSVTYPAVLVCAGGVCTYLVCTWKKPWDDYLKDAACLLGPWVLFCVLWFACLYVTTHDLPWTGQSAEAAEAAGETAPEPEENGAVNLIPKPPGVWTVDFYRVNMRGHLCDGPLRWLMVLGFAVFITSRTTLEGPGRSARFLLFLIPFLLVLSLSPDQFYPRYGLALLPFPLAGIGVVASWMGRVRGGRFLAGLLILASSLPPTYRNLAVAPQPWGDALDYLLENWEPGDRLLVGTHQSEMAVFLYNAGRIPRDSIVYRAFNDRKLWTETVKRPDRCWLIQWFDLPPQVEAVLSPRYEKVAVFPGRYGQITLYRKVVTLPGEEPEAAKATESAVENDKP